MNKIDRQNKQLFIVNNERSEIRPSYDTHSDEPKLVKNMSHFPKYKGNNQYFTGTMELEPVQVKKWS